MTRDAAHGHAGHVARLVRNRLGAHVYESATALATGDELVVARDRLVELLDFLKRDPDADLSLLIDVTAVDRLPRTPRFEVRWHLRSARLGYRAHLVSLVDEDDAVIPSLVQLYAGAESLERELYEMFGIYPDGHPHLRPWLLYQDLVGHPLKRDYRATKQQPLVPPLQDARAPALVEGEP
ncbi:MAG: NADH-quinone oxidoreductase subunit C [Deltaproteobacteria bacterium]|nr:NADH-quinone oxidoreductase subunit C [Deltaproteobacteria bacterium]